MFSIFEHCDNFTGMGLENWDISNVSYRRKMFDECKKLKNIPSWYR